MGDPVVQTPAFDRIAREGVMFTHAFSDAPSCAPSRSAILTGQHIWRLEEAGNLHSRLPDKFATYVRLLKQAGYVTGSQNKAWAPGQFLADHGWVHNSQSTQNPAGPLSDNFEDFLKLKPTDKPFCYWLGSNDPHRPYDLNSGVRSGMNRDQVLVPEHLPDDPVIRADILDYYFEVQRFDKLVADAIACLERTGQLDNTLVVVTSDHGMPFPRAKATLYDFGSRVPLAIRWPKVVQAAGRNCDELICLSDLAPTFLDAAGVDVPASMTARSLLDLLRNGPTASREAVYMAMERHDGCRPGGAGYPCRAIRTCDFLYIRNYEPTRWPAGDPNAQHCARAIPFGEVDSSPTKSLMMDRIAEPEIQRLHHLAFGMRPAEELYDLSDDPAQLTNVAGLAEYSDAKIDLAQRLDQYTRQTGDPRALGLEAPWDHYPYYGIRINKDWTVKRQR
jgi:N-sulfoglucosamine sulfohydrolase